MASVSRWEASGSLSTDASVCGANSRQDKTPNDNGSIGRRSRSHCDKKVGGFAATRWRLSNATRSEMAASSQPTRLSSGGAWISSRAVQLEPLVQAEASILDRSFEEDEQRIGRLSDSARRAMLDIVA
jgi:hypothetical protein